MRRLRTDHSQPKQLLCLERWNSAVRPDAEVIETSDALRSLERVFPI